MQQSWRAQVLELEHRLAASSAEWKVGGVFGRGAGLRCCCCCLPLPVWGHVDCL